MIEVLSRTLRHPGEWILLGLGLLGLLALPALRRWSTRLWPWLPCPAALAALGGLAAWYRETASVALVPTLRGSVLSGHVASQHAAAASGLWWAWTLAAALCAASAALLGGVKLDRAGLGGLAGALAVAAVGALGAVPGAVWTAGVLAGAALVRHEDVRATTLAIVAGWLGAAAAGLAAEAELARALALTELEEGLARMIPAFHARAAMAAAAGLAAAGTIPLVLRSRSPWLVGVAVALAAGTGTWARAWSEARAWAAAPELAGLRSAAPVHRPEQGWRWTGGCLWARSGQGWESRDVGTPSERHRSGPCPASDTPRLADRPVLLLDADAPLDLLDALGPPGEVRLLVRLDAEPGPAAIEPWRWATETVPVLVPPSDPRFDPRWRTRSEPIVVTGDVPDLPARPGLDLVVPARGVTVGRFLEVCASARGRQAVGLRCIAGVGDWSGL